MEVGFCWQMDNEMQITPPVPYTSSMEEQEAQDQCGEWGGWIYQLQPQCESQAQEFN